MDISITLVFPIHEDNKKFRNKSTHICSTKLLQLCLGYKMEEGQVLQ